MAGGKDLIRYDLLVQDALKGVVRKVLIDAKDGLPGEHHFYISFQTDFPGVRLSNRLREKYPQEMTIVLQHQYWDLNVTEHTFEVGLSFSGVPERLLIPFDALTGFFDPSVQFGLKFDLSEGSEEEVEDDEAASVPKLGPPGAASEPSEMKPRSTGLAAISSGAPKVVPGLPVAQNTAKSDDAKPARPAAKKAEAGTPTEPAPETGAEVVSLDAFRKKS